jgi:hypothetical protein
MVSRGAKPPPSGSPLVMTTQEIRLVGRGRRVCPVHAAAFHVPSLTLPATATRSQSEIAGRNEPGGRYPSCDSSQMMPSGLIPSGTGRFGG